MAVLGVDDFKSKLRGGGARPNLFKATINFPGYANGDPELTSFLCETAQLPGSTLGQIIVPFRGRQLKMAGDRTFDVWTVTIINDTDFAIRNSMERCIDEELCYVSGLCQSLFSFPDKRSWVSKRVVEDCL